MVHDIIFLDK